MVTQERKGPINLRTNPRGTDRVSLKHPAGQTGIYRPVTQGFPVVCYRKTDKKGHRTDHTHTHILVLERMLHEEYVSGRIFRNGMTQVNRVSFRKKIENI